MKASSRPVSAFVVVLLLAGFSWSPLPARHAIAKTRPEVQLGDPTDTDPGPAPGTGAKTASPLAVRSHSSAIRVALGVWLRLIASGYRWQAGHER